MKYQVLTADKTEDVTLEAAQAALAEEYPEYKVEVHDDGQQFIAKLTSKVAADDEEEDEAEEAGPPKGKKPPFLEEKDDEGDEDDEGEEPKKPKGDDEDADGDDDGDEDGPKGDDLGFQDEDAGVSDVAKALKALKTLDHVLPKLKDQLKSLNGGDDLGGPEGPGGPDGPGGEIPPPPGPGGLGGPPKGVGPTPGAPPGAALPPPPGGPGKGIPAPNVNHGLDMRKGPSVGPSTFSSVQDKILNRPVANEDGTRSTLFDAASQIAENPRYASYYVHEVKYDDENDQWVAHLKSR